MDLDTFTNGVREALDAAAEEHDRDGYEIVCPASVRDVQTVVEQDGDRVILVTADDGKRFRIRVEEDGAKPEWIGWSGGSRRVRVALDLETFVGDPRSEQEIASAVVSAVVRDRKVCAASVGTKR